MSRFTDKVVIITGATGVIGKAVVRRLANEGAKLTLVDMNEKEIEKIVLELQLQKDKVLVVKADVSKEQDVKKYVEKTVEQFGQIDGFANNAGVEGPAKPIEEVTEKDFDFVYNINVKGALLGIKYVLPIMKKQKRGAIVNTSSGAGLIGSPGMVLYNSSKHALMGINKVAAMEAADYNVRVNTVNPGVINTRVMHQFEADVAPASTATDHAVLPKRYGEPEEVANVITFLLSDEASYVSSSSYTVDGGLFDI